jgi:hypothetical protein
MNIQSLAKNAQLYVRSEVLVAEIKLRLYFRKLGLAVFAAAVALLGLTLLNISLFHALETAWGPIWTPLILGLANFALAVIALLIAATAKPGPELAMAEDLRKLSAIAVEADLQSSQSLGGGLIEASAARLLIPALASIIGALRRKKAPKK